LLALRPLVLERRHATGPSLVLLAPTNVRADALRARVIWNLTAFLPDPVFEPDAACAALPARLARWVAP
jgi:hypothetical protein